MRPGLPNHLVCLRCKKIEDLYDDALNNLALSPKITHQYRIVGHRVEFHGYCSDCKKEAKPVKFHAVHFREGKEKPIVANRAVSASWERRRR
jgi:hypothetical protein